MKITAGLESNRYCSRARVAVKSSTVARCVVISRIVPHVPATAPAETAAETMAEGIAIAEPARLAQMLDIVSESGGTVLTATEQGIASARLALATKGVDVEPTAATVYAAWLEWPDAPEPSSTVLALTGAGLKSPPPSHPAATALQPGEGHQA